jgi:hypothetical protein
MAPNIPNIATIGTSTSWVSIFDDYSSASSDLTFVIGAQSLSGIAQSHPQIGWSFNTDFSFAKLGACPWVASIKNRSSGEVSEVATGSIFLETVQYSTLRQTAEEMEKAILQIARSGGHQSAAVKGRSYTRYDLAAMQRIAETSRSKMAKLTNGGFHTLQAVFY